MILRDVEIQAVIDCVKADPTCSLIKAKQEAKAAVVAQEQRNKTERNNQIDAELVLLNEELSLANSDLETLKSLTDGTSIIKVRYLNKTVSTLQSMIDRLQFLRNA